MKVWQISKQFDFCYGHRVWSQELNKEFSMDSCLACRHFHGHQGKVIIYLESTILNKGMVTDFKHLNWFKKWLDEILDHKFIMDIHDPILPYELASVILPAATTTNAFITHDENFLTLDPEIYKDAPLFLKEKIEGLVFVPFVPTSENLSKWLFDIVAKRMKTINITVSKIEFFETPKSKSTYINDENTEFAKNDQ
ncbi:MAG: 6-carboxytetrahydropterin synthase [Novosphingobium sp.]|nr:6-carboxytetrahydropterin synthase [Novosphingobium sp.]